MRHGKKAANKKLKSQIFKALSQQKIFVEAYTLKISINITY
jgi:hypothetical protein